MQEIESSLSQIKNRVETTPADWNKCRTEFQISKTKQMLKNKQNSKNTKEL